LLRRPSVCENESNAPQLTRFSLGGARRCPPTHMSVRNFCSLRFLVIAASLLGCRHRLDESLVPACPAPAVSTDGWNEVRALGSPFTLKLPPGARDSGGGVCIDSACGRIEVGRWQLAYDGGAMAGGGHGFRPVPDSTQATNCVEAIDGRQVFVQTYRFPDVGDSRWRGYFVAQATMLVTPDYPLNLAVISKSTTAIREFLTALRTLHVEPGR
jgi:hypothetical protein